MTHTGRVQLIEDMMSERWQCRAIQRDFEYGSTQWVWHGSFSGERGIAGRSKARFVPFGTPCPWHVGEWYSTEELDA